MTERNEVVKTSGGKKGGSDGKAKENVRKKEYEKTKG